MPRDFIVPGGAIFIRNNGRLFVTEYQVNEEKESQRKEGALVGHRLTKDKHGIMSLGPRATVGPKETVTSKGIMSLDMVTEMFPRIIVKRQEKPQKPERPWGFDKSRTTLPKLK